MLLSWKNQTLLTLHRRGGLVEARKRRLFFSLCPTNPCVLGFTPLLIFIERLVTINLKPKSYFLDIKDRKAFFKETFVWLMKLHHNSELSVRLIWADKCTSLLPCIPAAIALVCTWHTVLYNIHTVQQIPRVSHFLT